MHPQYGPAVFDYNYGCWTYPYAEWYGGQDDQQQYSGDEEDALDAKEPSRPERHEISIQKDFDVEPKPEVNIMATQTADEEQTVTQDSAIQTQVMKVSEAGTSPAKTPSAKVPEQKVYYRYTKDEAARMITRRCRLAVHRQREAAYRHRDTDGALLTKKWAYNKLSGGSEILAMYAAPGPDQRCLCLRFTIFDYAAK